MTVSRYIECLQKLQAIFGDLEVCTTRFNGERIEAPGPIVAYAKVPTVRERKCKFWHKLLDDAETKGHAVIKL